jgi:hypothetical protein
MKGKRHLITCIALFLFLPFYFLLNCTGFINPFKGGTNTGDALIIGYVYNQVGANLEPVADATVSFIQSDIHPDSAAVLSVATDEKGFYEVKKDGPLTIGNYNVFAEKDNRKAYKKRAITITDLVSNDTINPLTLSETGSVIGVVLLEPPHKNNQAIILLHGTNYYCRPDTNGVFTLDSLAPGEYEARIIAEPDGYITFDTVFSIYAGKVDTVSDTIRLQNSAIPPVQGFTLNYDTSAMVANFSWNQSDSRIVKGYIIYLARHGEMLKPVDTTTITDTFFVDDVFNRPGETLIYSIAAIDSNQNRSIFADNITLIVLEDTAVDIDSITLTGNFSLENNGFIDTSSIIYAYNLNVIYKYNRNGTLISSNEIDSLLFNTASFNTYDKYIQSLQRDALGNIFIMTQTVEGPLHIRKYSPDLSFIGEAICSTSLEDGDSTYFTLSSDGNIFVMAFNIHFGENYKNNIYRYDSSFNLDSVCELDGEIRGISMTNDTLTVRSYVNNYQNSLVKFYDLDFNLLKTWNETDTIAGIYNGNLSINYGRFLGYKICGYSAIIGLIDPWNKNGKQLLLVDGEKNIKVRMRISNNAGMVAGMSSLFSIYNNEMFIYNFNISQ